MRAVAGPRLELSREEYRVAMLEVGLPAATKHGECLARAPGSRESWLRNPPAVIASLPLLRYLTQSSRSAIVT